MDLTPVDDLAARLGRWQDRGGPLYVALADTLAALVRSGELPPDTRLPSERRLADTLRVSRGTVMAAYDHLRDQALVATRRGSGTTVLRAGSPVSGPREAHVAATLTHRSIFRGFLGLDEDQIDMCGAYWTGGDDLPNAPFERALRRLPAERTSHGYSPFGLEVLREAIAGRLTAAGLPTTGDQLLITTGAQQAIALITQLAVAPGDTVVTEATTYPGALEALMAQQARVVPVGVSGAGVDLTELQRAVATHAPRLVYLIPSVHNPTGVTMPGPARARLAELAADWDTLLVDDRTLADTQWDGAPPLPIAAHVDDDTAARVLTVGSTSKTLWGGLRIGWIRAGGPILQRLARLKSIVDLGTPVASQLVATEFLAHQDDLLAARRQGLHDRYLALTGALADRVDWAWQPPVGGLCLWVDLGGASADDFCRVAADHGVSLVPGSVASATGHAPSRLRLPFGQPPEVLTEAARRLGAAWEDYRARVRPPSDRPVSVVV